MGGIFWWIIVGLIAGWLAGKVMKGGGYGVIVDIILGYWGEFSADGCSGCWGFHSAASGLDRSSWRLWVR